MIIESKVKSEADKASSKLNRHPETRNEVAGDENINKIEIGLMNRNEIFKILMIQEEREQKFLCENVRLETELEITRRQLNLVEPNSKELGKTLVIKEGDKKFGNTRLDYLQKDEVAQRLRKSTRWVEQQCKSGVIPYIKIKRSVLFDWGEVVKSLDNLSRGGVVRRY
jgi:hypothetical protein